MWTETAEGRKLIQEISKSIVIEVAPEELDLFDELAAEYFLDPSPPDLSQPLKDDPLGFGLGETLIAVAPAATAMVSSVISHLMAESIKATQEESTQVVRKKIKALFNRGQTDEGSAEQEDKNLPPLTKEQMEQVKKLARKQAIKFGMTPDRAEMIANALIGLLALSK